ncbi:hypothetical protein LTR37_017073 [Vermiconidia calcicola]|uniref:Uncharacterized protein n=1 Tax=Vermiconidia calcicola TaxID=1690605 RepID=A0ACC3MMI4_9PEZI|nr:hypothetical protein LTR37_017073 [Vermiconidia calcicola]
MSGSGGRGQQAEARPSKKRKADEDPTLSAFQAVRPKKAARSAKKDDRPNTTEATIDLTPTEQLEEDRDDLEEKRNDRVIEAKRKLKYHATLPEYNVFVLKDSVETTSVPAMAGYLNCPNTTVLWDRFWNNKEVYGMLDQLYAQYKKPNPFGMVVKIPEGAKLPPKPRFSKVEVFRRLAEGKFQAADITSTSDPGFDRFSADSSLRMYVYFLRVAYRVMQAVPESFPGTAVPRVARVFLPDLEISINKKGFDAEDLNRLFVLFHSFYSKKRDQGAGQIAHKERPPQLPIFCYPSEARVNTVQQTERNKRAFKNLFSRTLTSEQLAKVFAFSTKKERAQQPHAVDQLSEEKVMLDEDLPHLEDGDCEAILQYLANQVQYLYDNRDRRVQFFNPAQTAVDGQHDAQIDRERRREAYGTLNNQDQQNFRQDVFVELQRRLNDCSAAAPSWEETAELLSLVVENLKDAIDPLTKQDFRILYRGMTLMPWQPEAVAFILKMIRSRLKTCMVCDDTGTGKTIEILVALIQLSIDTQTEIDRIRGPELQRLTLEDGADGQGMNERATPTSQTLPVEPQTPPSKLHKPILIVVPPSAIGAWMSDAGNFFQDAKQRRNINMCTFFGPKGGSTGTAGQHSSAGNNAEELAEFCASLNPMEESTSRTCILTTFRSFATRCLGFRRGELSPTIDVDILEEMQDDTSMRANEQQQKDDKAPVQEEDEDAIGDGDCDPLPDHEVTIVEKAKLLIPRNSFSYLVVDEAHRLKDPKSLQAIVVNKLDVDGTIMCSATPFINSVRDLYGLLRFFWRVVSKSVEHLAHRRPNQAAFAELQHDLISKYHRDIHQIQDESLDLYLSALDPEHFKGLVGTNTAAVEQDVSRDVIPTLIMLTSLRRVMGQELRVAGRKIKLGANIPRFEITTMLLRQGDVEASLYGAIHEAYLKDSQSARLIVDDNDLSDENNPPANVRRRRLQQACLNPGLDQLHQRNVNGVKDVRKLFDKSLDSFGFFHTWTKSDMNSTRPATRIDMAVYIAETSVKMQALAAEILQVVLIDGGKMLIYADWPTNLWLIELFLEVLQIKFLSIRAGVSTRKRLEAENAYNNDNATKVLVCSSRSAAESLNLQRGGWHIMVIDLVPINVLHEIVGRGFRVGQKHAQTVKAFASDETFDQYLLHKYVSHYRSQVAATADLGIPKSVLAGVKPLVNATERLDTSQRKDYTKFVNDAVVDTYVDGLARSVLGMRARITEAWADVQDVGRKNLDPEEQLFRLAYGGRVADEVLDQAREAQRLANIAQLEDLEAAESGDGQKSPVKSSLPSTTALRSTPFAAAKLPRKAAETTFTEGDHIRALVRAAQSLASTSEFRLHEITTVDCLSAVKEWILTPSPCVDRALVELAKPESAILTAEDDWDDEDMMDVDEEDPSVTEATPLSHSGAVIADTPDELTPERKADHDRYSDIVLNFKTRGGMQNFSKEEFGQDVIRKTRVQTASAIAMHWVQKDSNDRSRHQPDWTLYEEDAKRPWGVVSLAEDDGEL